MKKRFNLKEQEGETSEEELYDSLGTVLELATTMCNDHENETYDTLDPHEALDCLHEIDTPRAHRLIEMIKFYDDELDSMDAEEDYRDDDEFMDEYGEDELPDWMEESKKIIKLKEADLHRIVKRVIKEQLTTPPLSLKRTKATPNYSEVESYTDSKKIANAIVTGMCFGELNSLEGENSNKNSNKNSNMRSVGCDDKEPKVAAAFTAIAKGTDPYKMYIEVQELVQDSTNLEDDMIDIVKKFIPGVIINDKKSWKIIIDSYNSILKQAKKAGYNIWTGKKTNNGKEIYQSDRSRGGHEI